MFITMNDITNKKDVQTFVDAFYQKIQQDSLLGPVFASKIATDAWFVHLERMYSFWNTVLFGQKDYRGNPFSKHASLPIELPHFEQWLHLFFTTIDANFKGPKAEEAKLRATKMATLFESKLSHIRSSGNPSFNLF